MGLSGVIPVGVLQAIAGDRGSYAGVSRSQRAIAIDTRYCLDILLSDPRMIVKFY
ncbi:hypothetical protein [Oscillatoria acuminata]|uniref:hypothetical protein n=1 Tax=Oscillatoria acuminata TaxID=118323 RepID=UPI0003075F94|nr:hypothetical protein [Oscillatoria acuminata]